MIEEFGDAFVGSIGILIGLFFMGSAITNWEWTYTLPSARGLQRMFGRTGARIMHLLLGIALLCLGIAIASGYRWPVLGPK